MWRKMFRSFKFTLCLVYWVTLHLRNQFCGRGSILTLGKVAIGAFATCFSANQLWQFSSEVSVSLWNWYVMLHLTKIHYIYSNCFQLLFCSVQRLEMHLFSQNVGKGVIQAWPCPLPLMKGTGQDPATQAKLKSPFPCDETWSSVSGPRCGVTCGQKRQLD